MDHGRGTVEPASVIAARQLAREAHEALIFREARQARRRSAARSVLVGRAAAAPELEAVRSA